MRKKNIVLYTVRVFALAMVLIPLSIAKPNTRLNGDCFIQLQWDFVGFNPDPVGNPGDPNFQNPYSFIGTVSGDIDGDLYIALLEAWFPAPGVEHFIEYWRIEPETGGYIDGENKGKWTMSNFKWLANGEVTGASLEYEYLIGSKWQYSGKTNNPDIDDPVVGYGTWHITHNK